MNRKNYKHGNYVDAEPNPHVDIKKYVTKDGKDDGKRYRVPDSEMKVSKKKRKGLGLMGGPSPAKMARPGLGGQQARKKQDKKKTGGLGLLGGSRKKEPEVMMLKMVEEGPANKHKSMKFQKMKKTTNSEGNIEFVELKAKGGRAGYKHGGAAKRGLGRAFMKGGKV